MLIFRWLLSTALSLRYPQSLMGKILPIGEARWPFIEAQKGSAIRRCGIK